jgi:uncharacterized membrane protein YdjX (TVP38/TMEM64 family)
MSRKRDKEHIAMKALTGLETRKRKSAWSRLLLAIAAAAFLLAAARYFHVQELLKYSLGWIAGSGLFGPVIFIVIYILACVLLIPGSILTLGAGFVFGVVKGTVIVWVAATLGATAAFLVGRYLARDWVSEKIDANPRFKAIDEAVAREGWKIVGLVRLSPVFPFNLLNYMFGLTRVSLRHYFFASWIGMLPGTVMYVYIGSLAGDLATLGAGGRTRTPAEWALYAFGFVATIAVVLYVTRLARHALEKKA